MSNKFFSKDDRAALAYEANQSAACGYEDEAEMIRKENDFHLNVNARAFLRRCLTRALQELMVLWKPAIEVMWSDRPSAEGQGYI